MYEWKYEVVMQSVGAIEWHVVQEFEYMAHAEEWMREAQKEFPSEVFHIRMEPKPKEVK